MSLYGERNFGFSYIINTVVRLMHDNEYFF